MAMAMAMATVAAACAPQAPEPREPPPLETEEVTGAVDRELSTEADEKGEVPRDTGDWYLPGDFPKDLPLYRPARFVDFGDSESGGRYVVFHASGDPERVGTDLLGRVERGGWRTTGSAEAFTAERSGTSVEIAISPLDPGAEIRIDY